MELIHRRSQEDRRLRSDVNGAAAVAAAEESESGVLFLQDCAPQRQRAARRRGDNAAAEQAGSRADGRCHRGAFRIGDAVAQHNTLGDDLGKDAAAQLDGAGGKA